MSAKHHRGDWHRLAVAIKNRDGWRCQKCEGAGKLEVHHIRPAHAGGTDDPENLITLCRRCHVAIHKKQMTPERKEWAELAKRYR